MKAVNARKCVQVAYIMNIIYLLDVSATLGATLRDVYSKGWILQSITKVFEPVHSCKILSFNDTCLK